MVNSIVERAASFEDGLAVSRHVLTEIEQHGSVALSFLGIETMTTSFLNGLFVTIVKEKGSQFLFQSVRLIDVSRQPRQMIMDRLIRRMEEIEGRLAS